MTTGPSFNAFVRSQCPVLFPNRSEVLLPPQMPLRLEFVGKWHVVTAVGNIQFQGILLPQGIQILRDRVIVNGLDLYLTVSFSAAFKTQFLGQSATIRIEEHVEVGGVICKKNILAMREIIFTLQHVPSHGLSAIIAPIGNSIVAVVQYFGSSSQPITREFPIQLPILNSPGHHPNITLRKEIE